MPAKLGQNFLRDKSVVNKIIAASGLASGDFVVEIGPGEGVLTEALAMGCRKVVAVEIDRSLISNFKKKLKDQKNVEIIEGDILKINLNRLIFDLYLSASEKSERSESKIKNYPYKLISNIPYYITSPIIKLFLEAEYPPKEMILMVQKEVAERIVAKPGKMSILAVSVQYYADTEILFNVQRTAFYPVPDVDSAVIKIVPHFSNSFLEEGAKKDVDKNFFRIVRAGFCSRRKTLANNLSNSFHLNKKGMEEKIISLDFNSSVRAQELSVKDWKKLAQMIFI